MGTTGPVPLPTVGYVNETSQTRPLGPHTEAGLARGALHALRRDLISGAFDFHPLPPLETTRAGRAAHLPKWIGRRARWTPHALVVLVAAVVFLASVSRYSVGPAAAAFSVAAGVVLALPVLLTLFRPIGAFWISLGVLVFSLITQGPWAADSARLFAVFFVHITVMALVVLRTRPRLAAEMWLTTFVVPGVFTLVFRGQDATVAAGAVVSGLVLIVVSSVRAWHLARRQVVETATVTARERSRRTALEERATIARELHDVVAHHMSVIAIQAEAAPYRVADTPPELAAALATIRENAVAALTELRRILGVVRSEDPAAFADADPEAPQPTLASLGSLLESVRGAGLNVEHVVTGSVRTLPQGVELSAYRIIQEALSNTLRHAPGAEARVEVSYVLGGLGLRIVNGPPNRLAKPSPGAGHGVLGMHERVQMLGGEMTAGATDEGGYEVAAFIPVTASAGSGGSTGSTASPTSSAPDLSDGAA